MGVQDRVAARVGGRPDGAWCGAAGAALLAGSLAVAAGPAAAGGRTTAVPARVFAPYVDMSLTESENLLADGNKAGLDVVTLAFVVSAVNAKGEPVCAPAWGGIGPIGRDRLANGITLPSLVRAIRKAGGDVIVSFEGANPTELALACPTAAKLQAAYQVVVDRYQATSTSRATQL